MSKLLTEKPSDDDENLSAFRLLMRRYKEAWQIAWKNRRFMEAPARYSDEVHFLPAALSLQETPVHPAPRYIQKAIISFAVVTVIWACFGEVDVVATGSGKIVPNGRSKIIQASDVAVVSQIYVEEGQMVAEGQLLIELDNNITKADVGRLENDLDVARIDLGRSNAMLIILEKDNIEKEIKPVLPNIEISADQEILLDNAQTWLNGQYLTLRVSLAQVDAEIEQRKAEIRSAKNSISKLKESIPISQQQALDYKNLMAEGYVSKHAWLEREQIRLEQERELSRLQTGTSELEAILKQSEHRKDAVIANLVSSMNELKNRATQSVRTNEQELKKAQQRDKLTRITSPVAGTVQQLAINTVGGVTTEAQALMLIVPKDSPIEVEAKILNKDIGFIQVGQEVEVKIDTFNFTKYGIVPGKILTISHDAIEDEQMGLVYNTRIELQKKNIRVGANDVDLSPGMSVRIEIKTDKRKVIEYFLSPLQKYVSESLGER